MTKNRYMTKAQRTANGLPSRQPDFIFANDEYWFEEMIALISAVSFADTVVAFLSERNEKLIYRPKAVTYYFEAYNVVQKAYKDWKTAKAESMLIGE